MSGVSLNNANLLNVVGLSSAIVNPDTVYNQWTIFPNNYDPVAAGLTRLSSAVGDFNANNELDLSDIELLMERILPQNWPFFPGWLDEKMFDLNADGNIDPK